MRRGVVCSVGGGVVWCGDVLFCVVWCGLACGKTPPCVRSKRLRVCVQDASVCTGKTPACVEHATFSAFSVFLALSLSLFFLSVLLSLLLSSLSLLFSLCSLPSLVFSLFLSQQQ